MRTLVLILMVALLPLRLWAAEGMAVRMTIEQAQAAAGVADMADMPEDCPMKARAKAEGGLQDPTPQAAGHCTACHLSAAATSLLPTLLAAGPAPTGPPEAGSPRFASAELAPDLRPPIS